MAGECSSHNVWFFSRREIEENSPSKRDGIALKKEMLIRKSYSTFLQDLGKRLLVPQVAIATAITFCHRFFVRQSHAKNDGKTIAIACMFLAAKVEETPRALRDLIVVSYEMIHEKDRVAAQRIRTREVYEQQKELVLRAENVVLSTLDFDFDVSHPYTPLMDAVKSLKALQAPNFARVAWNFVNDSLRTSLCLQYKPHQIAATAIFLAAKLLKIKLPSNWWDVFHVTRLQLDEMSKQLLELYELRPTPSPLSPRSDVGSSCTETVSPRPTSMNAAIVVEHGGCRQTSSHLRHECSNPGNRGSSSRANQNQIIGDGRCESSGTITDHKGERDREIKGKLQHPKDHGAHKDNVREVPQSSKEDSGRTAGVKRRDVVGQSPEELKLLREKVKAKLDNAKRLRCDQWARKKSPVDEEDLIERELEDVEIASKAKNADHMVRPKTVGKPGSKRKVRSWSIEEDHETGRRMI